MLSLKNVSILLSAFLPFPIKRISQLLSKAQAQPSISLSPEWRCLGPFQIGTREAVWGADPLEASGGFHSLNDVPGETYLSSLASNGTVSWSTIHARDIIYVDRAVKSRLVFRFSDVGWTSLQKIYGWSALQYQGWARGSFTVHGHRSQIIQLHACGILEFWIDDEHFFGGDIYAFRRAPTLLFLEPGTHRIDVRLIRDVRIMGAKDNPAVEAELELLVPTQPLTIADNAVLLPDVVDGTLASTFGSVTLQNSHDAPVDILQIQSGTNFHAELHRNSSIHLAPGQTRPIAFKLSLNGLGSKHVRLEIKYCLSDRIEDQITLGQHGQHGEHTVCSKLVVSQSIQSRALHELHKITFIHSTGVVSSALLRAPWKNTSLKTEAEVNSLPVLMNLHGAGVDADSQPMRHSLDAFIDELPAWVLFPQGVTSWGSDDWHHLGWLDAEASISAIRSWIETVDWRGASVNERQLLVAGHSNGAQGVWYAVSHRPNDIIAAAAVSGYTSIQAYVPFQFWREAEASKMGNLMAALDQYRHELLVPTNAAEIPTMLQHGSADDNVPAFHSRRMRQLLGTRNCSTNFQELPGYGHWFEGVMTTKNLQHFFKEHLSRPRAKDLPEEFSLVVANPAQTGPKYGLHVKYLTSFGIMGRINVSFISTVVAVTTANIHAFELTDPKYVAHRNPSSSEITSIIIDNEEVLCPANLPLYFQKAADGAWRCCDPRHAVTDRLVEVPRKRTGSLDSILQTKGKFLICSSRELTFKVGLQMSRNLFQYFGANAEILAMPCALDPNHGGSGNVISLGVGTDVAERYEAHPIKVHSWGVSVREVRGTIHKYYPSSDGLAAVFLRPLPGERLELVVWGYDIESLECASRLVPLMTGTGQPDFVIMTRQALWKGVEGAVALGFFDFAWNVTNPSYLS